MTSGHPYEKAVNPLYSRREDRVIHGSMVGEIWEVEPAAGTGWMVRRAGSLESESTHPSIEEAVERARQLARQKSGEALVKDRGGHITEHWTFRDFGRAT
jgi:hypothetical protein